MGDDAHARMRVADGVDHFLRIDVAWDVCRHVAVAVTGPGIAPTLSVVFTGQDPETAIRNSRLSASSVIIQTESMSGVSLTRSRPRPTNTPTP